MTPETAITNYVEAYRELLRRTATLEQVLADMVRGGSTHDQRVEFAELLELWHGLGVDAAAHLARMRDVALLAGALGEELEAAVRVAEDEPLGPSRVPQAYRDAFPAGIDATESP